MSTKGGGEGEELWNPQNKSAGEIEEILTVNHLMALDARDALDLIIDYVRAHQKVPAVDVNLIEKLKEFATRLKIAGARTINLPNTFENRETMGAMIQHKFDLARNLEEMEKEAADTEAILRALIKMGQEFDRNTKEPGLRTKE